MLEYVIRDVQSVLHFFPYGAAAGSIVLCIAVLRNAGRKLIGKEPVAVAPQVCFYMYLAILLSITLLSRESGTGQGRIDLELFSTWRINTRNRAYLIENILLFMPYGCVCAWKWERCRRFAGCAAVGIFTSVIIECIQLFGRRGVFQLDDILTNVLGCMLGWMIWRLFLRGFLT